MTDVVIAGAGPAGRALAAACAAEGLHTVLVDPAPHAPWRATYALWRDELPELPAEAIAAAPSRATAIGSTSHAIPREYLVVHNAGLRRWLTDPRVEVRTGRVEEAVGGRLGSTVLLAGGRRLATGVVVDAGGARRVLSGGPAPGARAEQTAFGVVLPAAEAARLVPDAGETALFMDWRAAGVTEPSFLYAIPLGEDRVLVEETSLARKPGLGLDVLAGRLRARLAAAGVAEGTRRERVRIPLDLPVARPPGVVPFGVAAGMVHPATGYSLATSVGLAPSVAAAIAEGLRTGPRAATAAARHEIWPPAALAVHRLRKHGLRALRGMPAPAVPEFFELFFGLPAELQRAFTSGRTDPAGTTAAMSELFRRAPWRLRRRLVW
ncbi:lycopene cyclase family protein [Amycolatopsis nigrescens]|uniref:lycopene cyclase family protein n=1 Tax=Amycolatopsis nigrescens TaxID=381445 RepID=UPI0003712ECC|nr:lycopene cyclase family protein [Amycolatopsis nigrescens]